MKLLPSQLLRINRNRDWSRNHSIQQSQNWSGWNKPQWGDLVQPLFSFRVFLEHMSRACVQRVLENLQWKRFSVPWAGTAFLCGGIFSYFWTKLKNWQCSRHCIPDISGGMSPSDPSQRPLGRENSFWFWSQGNSTMQWGTWIASLIKRAGIGNGSISRNFGVERRIFVSTGFPWASHSEAGAGWSIPADITPPAHGAVVPPQQGGSSSSESGGGQAAHSVLLCHLGTLAVPKCHPTKQSCCCKPWA